MSSEEKSGSAKGPGGKGSAQKPKAGAEAHKKSSRRVKWALGAAGLVAVAILAVILLGGDDDPTIPTGSVAVIAEAPPGMGEITKAQLEHQVVLTAAANGVDAPKPGDWNYDGTKIGALKRLIKRAWVVGQAEELGYTMSDQELAAKAKEVEAKKYKSKAAFKEALELRLYTRADFEESVRQETMDHKVEHWLESHVPDPSQEEIEHYYDDYKKNFKPQAEEVNIWIVRNTHRGVIEQAKRALESAEDREELPWDAWEKVAKKFSEDAKTKNDESSESVEDGELEEPLNKAVFNAPEARIQGPIKTPKGFVIFERSGRSLATKLQSLSEMEDEIKNTLGPQAGNKFIGEFGTDFNDRWRSRTFCAPDYLVKLCSNSSTTEE